MAIRDVPSPMTGTVLELVVAPGDSVEEGTELLILESMKMEIPVESPYAGTVEAVLVAIEQNVAEGEVLLRLS